MQKAAQWAAFLLAIAGASEPRLGRGQRRLGVDAAGVGPWDMALEVLEAAANRLQLDDRRPRIGEELERARDPAKGVADLLEQAEGDCAGNEARPEERQQEEVVDLQVG